MNVAILHYAAPPTIGGVEATIAAHARVLAAHGHRVRVIAGQCAPGEHGVETLIVPELGSRGARIEQVAQDLRRGAQTTDFVALAQTIAAQLAEALVGVEVVIVHNVLTLHKNLAFTAALHQLQAAGRAPHMLAWCHDFAWLDPLYTPELHAGAPWDLLRTAWPGVRYVVVSEDRRTMLATLFGLPPEQIAVVPPGVDVATLLGLGAETQTLISQLDLLRADPLLLLPARITRRKNIEQAIAIVGALRRQGNAARLVVTGPPGPHNPTNAAYLAQLQALRDATGHPASVVFLYESYTDAHGQPRPVADALVGDLYRLADGLLFPSRYEGFGMPVAEAALVGLPIFCSDIAPLRETAGDAATYFDPDGDPAAIATQIATQLRDDPRATLRRRVRHEYTWEAIYQTKIAPLLPSSGTA